MYKIINPAKAGFILGLGCYALGVAAATSSLSVLPTRK